MNADTSKHSEPTAVLSISGMTCGACANALTKILARVPGVTGAVVDLNTGRATVRGNPRNVALLAAVEAAGYGAHLLAGGPGSGVT